MSISDLLKAALPLVLILGLLFGAMMLLKKYSFRGKRKDLGILKIRVLNNKMIMPKKFISVVRIEDKLLVLGLSESSITLLKEFNLPEDDGTVAETAQGDESFFAVLKKNIGMRRA